MTTENITEKLPPRPFDISTEAGRRLYVEYIKANPGATRAEKSYADIEERFNFQTDNITREQVEQAFTPDELERMEKGNEFVEARAYNESQRQIFNDAVQSAQDKGVLNKDTGEIYISKAVEQGIGYGELAPLGVTPEMYEKAKAFAGITEREGQRIEQEAQLNRESRERLDKYLDDNYIKIGENYIPKETWDKLPKTFKDIAKADGFNEAVKEYNKQVKEFNQSVVERVQAGAAGVRTAINTILEFVKDTKPEGIRTDKNGNQLLWEDVRTNKLITDAEYNELKGQEQDYYRLNREVILAALGQGVNKAAAQVRKLTDQAADKTEEFIKSDTTQQVAAEVRGTIANMKIKGVPNNDKGQPLIWENIKTGELISAAEYDKLKGQSKDFYRLSRDAVLGGVIRGINAGGAEVRAITEEAKRELEEIAQDEQIQAGAAAVREAVDTAVGTVSDQLRFGEPDLAIWEDARTGKKITTEELNKLSGQEQDYYRLTRDAAADVFKAAGDDPAKAAVALAVVGSEIGTKMTPNPFDDIGVRVIVGLTIGTATAAGIMKASEWIKDYREQNASASNVIVIGKDNQAQSLPDLVRELNLEQVIPPKTLETITLEQLIPGRTGDKTLSELIPPKVSTQLEEGIKGLNIKNLVLINPGGSPEAITSNAGGVIQAVAVKDRIESQLSPSEISKLSDAAARLAGERFSGGDLGQKTTTGLSKELKGPEGVGDVRLSDVSRARAEWERQAQAALLKVFGTDYEGRPQYMEYLRARAILDDAKRQYIASLDPTPLKKGRIDVEAVSAAYLAQLINIPSDRAKNLTQVLEDGKTRELIEEYIDTYTKAITKGATRTQAASKAATKLNTKLQQLTRTAIKTSTRTATRGKVIPKTATAEAVKTTAASATATATTTSEMTTTSTSTTTKPPKFSGSKDKKAATTYLRSLRGLVAWRQGELDGQDVWHVIKYPYKRKDDYLTLVGIKPPGATVVRGPESAYKTANLLYGKAPNKQVSVDMGIQDVSISTKGRVSFTPDPKQITTGDFAIGGNKNVFPLSKDKKK